MIDLHCHILPAIDDGPKDIAESVTMARMAAADGTKIIVATPHLNNHLYDKKEILHRVTQLNVRLSQEKIPLTILAGADVASHFQPHQITDFTLNGSRSFLLEFPHTHIPHDAQETLFKFLANGLQPIITHPERNPSVISRPELLRNLVQPGVLVQVTAGSVTGEFGYDIQRCAFFLLEQGLVDIIATDAHGSGYRKPLLGKALREAEKVAGKQKAHKMVNDTPAAIITDKIL